MPKMANMLSEIEEFLSKGKYPETLKGQPGKKTNFRRKANNYSFLDGILYKRHGPARSLRQVLVDAEQQKMILQAVHEGSGETLESGAPEGHLGQDKTENRILDRFWWPGIREDVRTFVKRCEQCQKPATGCIKTAPELHAVPVPFDPWQRIGVDLCSMPKSKEGITCMVVVVDYLTKWVEAEPLPDKTASTVAAFLYRLICRHGCANVQINDQSSEFVNGISSHLHRLTGVQQRISGAYYPQTNGLTERYNRTIQTILLKLLTNPDEGQTPEDWPQALPRVLFAFRTSKQASTGYTPFYLMYGRHPCLPVDLNSLPL